MILWFKLKDSNRFWAGGSNSFSILNSLLRGLWINKFKKIIKSHFVHVSSLPFRSKYTASTCACGFPIQTQFFRYFYFTWVSVRISIHKLTIQLILRNLFYSKILLNHEIGWNLSWLERKKEKITDSLRLLRNYWQLFSPILMITKWMSSFFYTHSHTRTLKNERREEVKNKTEKQVKNNK